VRTVKPPFSRRLDQAFFDLAKGLVILHKRLFLTSFEKTVNRAKSPKKQGSFQAGFLAFYDTIFKKSVENSVETVEYFAEKPAK
jgi:hypothetical protein